MATGGGTAGTRLGSVAELRSLYLIAGTDGAKIDATRARLRARAERDGGAAALAVFEPGEGRNAPDHEALLGAIPAMSLTESRRYLLADGVERWRERQLDEVAAALGDLPPDLSVVLIARAKAPAKLLKAVKAAQGEIHEFEAPKAREMPRVLVAEAKRLGFRLDPAAARMLVDRMGASPQRLHNELERLALWAGEEGEVGAADLDAMIADTSEAVVWALSDALLERDPAAALRIAERLIVQGENVTGLIYGLASRLRKACAAAAMLEEGTPPPQVESKLGMHPYAAKQLVRRLQDVELADLHEATIALADLEVWLRGGRGLRGRSGLHACAEPRERRCIARRRERDVLCTRATETPLGAGDSRGPGLLAGRGVLVEGALLHGLVDARDELAVRGLDRARVAALDGTLQPSEVGLDGAGEQPVLGSLPTAA